MFIDGFLGLAAAISGNAVTEFSMPGYVREPISFTSPKAGVSRNATGWTFGAGWGPGQMAGRAIYDAPAGGNLLFVLPHFATRLPQIGGPIDRGDPGDIFLRFTALASWPNADAYDGLLPAGTVAGTTYDVGEIGQTLSNNDVTPAGAILLPLPGPQFQVVYASPLTVGPLQLVINRGVLQVQARAQAIA